MADTAPESSDLQAEIDALVQDNGGRLNVLQMQGVGIDMQTLTLRHLIETLFPSEEERQKMNLKFQQRLAEELTKAEEQVDRINLERSAQQGSGLIVPGAPVIDV